MAFIRPDILFTSCETNNIKRLSTSITRHPSSLNSRNHLIPIPEPLFCSVYLVVMFKNKYRHCEIIWTKYMICRQKTLHKTKSSSATNIALEREEKKNRKKVLTAGVFIFDNPPMQEPAEPRLTFVERSRRGACGISLGNVFFLFQTKKRSWKCCLGPAASGSIPSQSFSSQSDSMI